MLNTIEGVYRNGRIELTETPVEITEARVFVTFLPLDQPAVANGINLRERGMDEAQAASLRARLRAFTEDWERPEMEVYDAL
ncbi:MAG: hypothetical protein ACREEM_06045 [Blastocatellia bacterium]